MSNEMIASIRWYLGHPFVLLSRQLFIFGAYIGGIDIEWPENDI